ncbi:MAG: PQQ-dependent sugar dehydrogenase [Ardenticatenaceae bacterium]
MNIRRIATFFLGLLVVLVGVCGVAYVFRASLIRQVAPSIGVYPPIGPAKQIEVTLPDGFGSSIFAEGLSGPRFMTVGPDGTLFVAERSRHQIVALPDRDGDGRADEQVVVAGEFESPSSLVFRPGTNELYVGETPRVSRLLLDGLSVVERDIVIPDLPTERIHQTTTVLFGADGKLYVSVGSSCNVCEEEDARLATVWVYEADGSNGRAYMVGLRNAVGLALNAATGEIWASNNGRDLIGNELPPETVYVLEDGADAGWPRCHAGDLPDPEFGESPNACDGVAAPAVKMQAHTAPLGLTFYDGTAFPADYQGDLFIAFHGSWNRNPPAGYKIVRLPIENGQVAGPLEDFATGWLLDNYDSTGRPVDVTVAADGALLLSDDKGGFIYRIAWQGE